jgi:hypothetical protein
LKEARAVLATVEAAELALIEFSNLKRGVLSVQASQTIANYWLPRHLAAFRSAYPQIGIRLSLLRPRTTNCSSASQSRLVTSWKSNGCCASADQAPGQSLKPRS